MTKFIRCVFNAHLISSEQNAFNLSTLVTELKMNFKI